MPKRILGLLMAIAWGGQIGATAQGTWRVDGRYLCYTWKHARSE